MELARGRPDDSVGLSPPLLLFPSAAAWDQVLNLRDKASSPFLPSSFHSFSLPSLSCPISRFSLRCASFKSPLAALRCRLYPFSEPRPAPPGPKFSLKLRPGGNPKCLEIFHNSRPVVRRVRPAHICYTSGTQKFLASSALFVTLSCFNQLLLYSLAFLLERRTISDFKLLAFKVGPWRAMDGWMQHASLTPSPFPPPPPQLKPLISPSSHFLVSQQPTNRAPPA